MRSRAETTPEQFIHGFYTSLTEQVVKSDEDPEVALDRFFTPDIEQISDGVLIDRARLVAHIRPTRNNLVDYRIEVHEALADGDRVAARLTMHTRMRKGKVVITEVHLFGQFAPDGRMRRSHQITRTLSSESA